MSLGFHLICGSGVQGLLGDVAVDSSSSTMAAADVSGSLSAQGHVEGQQIS